MKTKKKRTTSASKEKHAVREAKRIAMFNHKGGVSKTTTTFNLGWMLASKGHRVVLVDADPQCNLSGLVLGYKGQNEFESFYEDEPERNIRAGLAPAFESRPKEIEPIECVQVEGNENLFLLPGHIRLSEWEVSLGMAQELSGTIQTLQNLPGSFAYLLDKTGRKYDAEYILIDMNPSLSSINQNLVMTSHYFIVPASPDYFSVMAIESLTSVLPRWRAWAQGEFDERFPGCNLPTSDNGPEVSWDDHPEIPHPGPSRRGRCGSWCADERDSRHGIPEMDRQYQHNRSK